MKKLINFFNSVCMVFPLGAAFICAIVCLLGGWESLLSGHDSNFYLLPQLGHKFFAAICILLIGVFFFFIFRIDHWLKSRNVHQNISCALFAATIFFFAFGVRLILIYIFREDLIPFSDFYRVWSIAHKNYGDALSYLSYYSLFPTYLNYSVYLQKIVEIFGDRYVYVLLLNALFTGVTGTCIYFIARDVTENNKIAILAGLIYAFMPSNIVYTTVGTPEFLTIGFSAVGVFLLIKTIKSASIKKKLYFALLGGIAVGIGSAFKTFGLVILIAFSMVDIFSEIGRTIVAYRDLKRVLKKAVAIAACLVLVWGGHIFVTDLAIKYTERVFQLELDYGTAIPHYLLIGLNTEGEGQLHLGTKSVEYRTACLNNGMEVAAAREYAYHILKEDWSAHPSKIASLFAKKMIWAWQDDLMPVFFFNRNVGLNPDSPAEKIIFGFSDNILPSVAQIYYVLVVMFALFGVWYFSKSEIHYEWEFLLLIIFGYWCVIMLSEAQSRYKCLIMPYMCIISAAGMNSMIQIFAHYAKGRIKSPFTLQNK